MTHYLNPRTGRQEEVIDTSLDLRRELRKLSQDESRKYQQMREQERREQSAFKPQRDYGDDTVSVEGTRDNV